jgi:hypothetical protein
VNHSLRGAFDSDGGLVEETRRQWDIGAGFPDSLPATLPSANVVRVCEDEVLWGGGLVHAYGHFLIESVARLWPLLSEGSRADMAVVWTTPRQMPYIRDWCEAFDVRTFELPEDGVMRFTDMLVPEPAWRLNAWIAPEIRDIHLRARAGLDVPSAQGSEILWLSRSGLPRARVAYDEVLLEWLLREHVTIVRPETMSLAEQVAAIEASQAVAGIVGSAFHTMLMAERVPACVMLCSSQVRGAHVDQNLLLGQGTAFVHGLATVGAAPSRKLQFPVKFPFGYRILIPEVLRALAKAVSPNLLEDENLRLLATPENLSPRVGSASVKDELMTAVARVLIDPLSMHGRMKLGRRFEEEGLHRCAAEQYMMVAELSDDSMARASYHAAMNALDEQ